MKLIKKFLGNLKHFFFIPITLGVLGGFSALIFRKLIAYFHSFLTVFLKVPHAYPFLLPLVFLFTYKVSRKLLVSPENVTVDEIAKKIALERGGFDPQKGLLVLLLTSFNIGFGAPVGREGPIAKLGGVLSELFNKLFQVDGLHFPIYLTCGVSAALSATFNAPAAAVLFGTEVVLGKINSYILIPLLISSSTATLVARYFLGDFRAFVVPHLTYSTSEIPFFPFISLLAAVSVFAISYSLKLFEFLRLSLKEYWHLVSLVLGLLVGFLLYLTPQAAGVGYREITCLFFGNFSPEKAGEIAFIKGLAVVLTFGSGVFGGFMAPAIFMGAFGGYSLGALFSPHPQVFALAGTAAFLSAISGAPLRSSLIIVELTHSYQLIVPILFTSALTNYFMGVFSQSRFFKRTLFHKGIDIEKVLLSKFDLKEFIVPVEPVSENDDVEKVKLRLLEGKERYLPVVNSLNRLVGVISLRDITVASFYDFPLKVKDVMVKEPFFIDADSDLSDLLKAVSLIEKGKLPVVDRERVYLGMFDCERFLRELPLRS